MIWFSENISNFRPLNAASPRPLFKWSMLCEMITNPNSFSFVSYLRFGEALTVTFTSSQSSSRTCRPQLLLRLQRPRRIRQPIQPRIINRPRTSSTRTKQTCTTTRTWTKCISMRPIWRTSRLVNNSKLSLKTNLLIANIWIRENRFGSRTWKAIKSIS